MRHGTQGRRQRNNRSGGRRGGNQRSQVFDSNGPEVRIRGTAFQVAEKYEALAKDAAGLDDRILEQSYLQHAEHYQRLIASWEPEKPAQDTYNEKKDVSGNVQPGNQEKASESEPQDSEPQKQTRTRRAPRKKQDDDLGLPSSILNAGVDEKLEDV